MRSRRLTCYAPQSMVAKAMNTAATEEQKAMAMAILLPLHQRIIDPTEIAVRPRSALDISYKEQVHDRWV